MKTVLIPLVLATLAALVLTACDSNTADYTISGSFEANTILISAEANGKVLDWQASEGRTVSAHQTLGYVDTTNLYLQKMGLLANTKGVKAQRPDMQKQTAAINDQLQKLHTERQRTQRLIQANAASTKQLEDIDAEIQILQSKLDALASTLAKSNEQITAQSTALEIDVARLDYQIGKCYIESPIDGTILQSYIDAGELAAYGMPLCQVADLTTLYLRAYFPYNALSRIKLGDTLSVYVDSGKSSMTQYPGTVSWISPQAEFTPKTVQTKNERDNLVYAVKVAVPNDGYLKIGMYGEIKLFK